MSNINILKKVYKEFSIDLKNAVPEVKSVNLAAYPWDQCMEDQIKQYGDEETAMKVCGAIKALYASKESMIEPNPCQDGYEAIGLKELEGKMVPNCVPIKEGMNVVKEGFPIPSPEGGESQNDYVSRCMHEIGKEYPQEQAVAICISTYQNK